MQSFLWTPLGIPDSKRMMEGSRKEYEKIVAFQYSTHAPSLQQSAERGGAFCVIFNNPPCVLRYVIS